MVNVLVAVVAVAVVVAIVTVVVFVVYIAVLLFRTLAIVISSTIQFEHQLCVFFCVLSKCKLKNTLPLTHR